MDIGGGLKILLTEWRAPTVAINLKLNLIEVKMSVEKDKAIDNINGEINNFRNSFKDKAYDDIYWSSSKITFYEEFYTMITSAFADEYLSNNDWRYISNSECFIETMYYRWLSIDDFSIEWFEMLYLVKDVISDSLER